MPDYSIIEPLCDARHVTLPELMDGEDAAEDSMRVYDDEQILDLLRRMTNENSVSSTDNGVTQTVDARQGVALSAKVEVKPRVLLRPFRTFLEVEQPESEFLLRVDAEKGIGLFEADGGIWKLEAKRNIAEYFAKAMGDLIESSKVVVMQ